MTEYETVQSIANENDIRVISRDDGTYYLFPFHRHISADVRLDLCASKLQAAGFRVERRGEGALIAHPSDKS